MAFVAKHTQGHPQPSHKHTSTPQPSSAALTGLEAQFKGVKPETARPAAPPTVLVCSTMEQLYDSVKNLGGLAAGWGSESESLHPLQTVHQAFQHCDRKPTVRAHTLQSPSATPASAT